jgi:cytochrome c
MTMKALNLALALAAAAVLISSTAFADGDADKGKKVFNKCKACHSLDAGKNKIGPSLHGVFGRKAGTEEGFKYSDAMKNSGITWSEDTLSEYLADPKGKVPGNKMAFVGLKKDDDRADVIAYLKGASM